MRSHRLANLDIAGREKALGPEPNFDLYRVRKIRALEITFESFDNLNDEPCLLATMEYEGEKHSYLLDMTCTGIRELLLPEMRPLLWVPELEIEDLRGTMVEGVRYELVSHGDRSFRCLCKDIIITAFTKMKSH
jgi:hypothetical protein